MPFKKGQGGRKPGTRNKAKTDIGEVCRQLVEAKEYQAYFAHRFNVGQCPPALESMVWHYAYGKPPESFKMPEGTTGELTIKWKS